MRLLWALLLVVLAGPLFSVSIARADHLMLGEIVAIGREDRGLGSEFIEIINPTGDDLNLSEVYLTNAHNFPLTAYYNIALIDPESANPGGGTSGKFHVRFPTGYTLLAGDSLVISVKGSTLFFEAYGFYPDFEIEEDGGVPDQIPDMVAVFPGSIGDGPTLAAGSLSIVMYTWNGQDDNVQDLDYFFWGTLESYRVNKTGETVGSHAYLPDTEESLQEVRASELHAFDHAWRRTDLTEGTETTTGGNGPDGHDETSENFTGTWADVTPSEPPAQPATFFQSSPVFTDIWPDETYDGPYEGQAVTFSATLASYSAVTDVDFYYSIDGSGYLSLAGIDQGLGVWTAPPLDGQAEGAVITWYAQAVNVDLGVAFFPVSSPLYFESWTVSEAPLPGEDPDKLLITEVSAGENFYPATYTGTERAEEFIEIRNPNPYGVDLSNYYLTDNTHYSTYGDQLYWQIALAASPDNIGGGNYNAFVARFPAGFTLAAGDSVVISVAGSDQYQVAFGTLPDLELYEDGLEADEVPDMRPVFVNDPSDLPGDSIYTPGRGSGSDGIPDGLPELEEYYGEPMILYYWQEGDDLVTDIDIFIWGNANSSYPFSFDKSGITIGSSTYLDDTPTADQEFHLDFAELGFSYTRVDFSEGTQTMTGGNGVAGRNETSENVATTFQIREYSVPAGPVVEKILRAELEVVAKTFLPAGDGEFPIRILASDGTETRLRLYDLQGRLVMTLFDSRTDAMTPDFYATVYWDGRDDNFQRVKAGMYILHLSVVSEETGEEITKTAPVVVATRLSH